MVFRTDRLSVYCNIVFGQKLGVVDFYELYILFVATLTAVNLNVKASQNEYTNKINIKLHSSPPCLPLIDASSR